MRVRRRRVAGKAGNVIRAFWQIPGAKSIGAKTTGQRSARRVPAPSCRAYRLDRAAITGQGRVWASRVPAAGRNDRTEFA